MGGYAENQCPSVKKRRDTCGVPAGYAVSGGLDRLPLDRLPMGQLDIKDGQQHDAAAHPLPALNTASMLMSRAATEAGVNRWA